jgi:mannose-1-phosphate guanylyltransferase
MGSSDTDRDERWALLLAGGDGVRLRPLTRAIAGDERPKQFCRILGGHTLLEATERRVARVVPSHRTLVALTRAHECYYRPLFERRPARSLIVQPENRGTAPAILYGALRIAAEAPRAAVAVFPTDHHVSDDRRFMEHVVTAFAALRARPELVILLGIEPDNAETEYGWIEPTDAIPGTPLFRVGRFYEKPSAALAGTLLARGGLWNSFVLVARVPALLALFAGFVSRLTDAFAALRSALGTADEERVARTAYSHLEMIGFSEAVLAARPANLATLPVRGVRWTDWGHPRRVLATLDELGIEPEWAEQVSLEAT